MKFDAHPMVVAAALGLLGPVALIDEEEDGESSGECSECSESMAADKSWGEGHRLEWEPGDAPDPAEFHRVEIEWLKLDKS
ncbi:MAG: hypothetical protein ABMB14_35945 [Myxococcota bacterium]